MQIKKFLNVIVTNCLIGLCSGQDVITCTFHSYDNCIVEYNKQRIQCNSVEEFSSTIKGLTKDCFTISYVSSMKDADTIYFHGFNSNPNKQYKLLIQGCHNFQPYICINYQSNIVNIPEIDLQNIFSLKIYSKNNNINKARIAYKDLDKILFNDKPISYFNNVELVSFNDNIKTLISTISAKILDYSHAITLIIFWGFVKYTLGL